MFWRSGGRGGPEDVAYFAQLINQPHSKHAAQFYVQLQVFVFNCLYLFTRSQVYFCISACAYVSLCPLQSAVSTV